jgi:hypothetical protein
VAVRAAVQVAHMIQRMKINHAHNKLHVQQKPRQRSNLQAVEILIRLRMTFHFRIYQY